MTEKLGPFELGKVHYIDADEGCEQLPDQSADLISIDCSATTRGRDSYRLLKPLGVLTLFWTPRQFDDEGKSHLEETSPYFLGGQFRVVGTIKNCDSPFMSIGTPDRISILVKESNPIKEVGENIIRVRRRCIVTKNERSFVFCALLIELFSPMGGVVLDPYAGSASLGVAAMCFGRKYLGFDNDPAVVEAANKNLGQHGGISLPSTAQADGKLYCQELHPGKEEWWELDEE